MIKLYDGQVAELFQNGGKDNPEIRSISYAIREEKRRIIDHADLTRTLAMIDILPDKILDVLAVELRTPGYKETHPIETKRELIKGTLLFFMKLGTPSAVNWAVRAVFGNGAIREWFDYEGEPHHFRVYAKNDGEHFKTEEQLEELMQLIDMVKRLSSWLDSIIIETGPFIHASRFGGVMALFSKRPMPLIPDEFDFLHTIYAGGVVGVRDVISLEAMPDDFDFSQTVHVGGAVGVRDVIDLERMPDEFDFSQTVHAGGVAGAIDILGLERMADEFNLSQTVHAGGVTGMNSKIPHPAIKDDINFSRNLRAGGQIKIRGRTPLESIADKRPLIQRGGAGATGTVRTVIPLPELP